MVRQKNYFNGVRALLDLKRVYIRRCKQLHPDKGGEETKFKEMFAQYQDMFVLLSTGEMPRPQSQFWQKKKVSGSVKKPRRSRKVMSNEIKKKVLKKIVRSALKKQVTRRVRVGGVIYIVDLNKMFTQLFDKVF